MSNSVAPLPTGVGVTVIAEHRSRREQDPHRSAEDEPHPEDHENRGSGQQRQHHEPAPPPVDEAAIVPAETLFAATLLASQFSPQPPSPEELKLRTGQGWTPPDSLLRLKDRLA